MPNLQGHNYATLLVRVVYSSGLSQNFHFSSESVATSRIDSVDSDVTNCILNCVESFYDSVYWIEVTSKLGSTSACAVVDMEDGAC